MPANPQVSVQKASKSFARRPAVDDVSLELVPGELCGLIGANGAGKSTLLAMLAGLVKPDAGSIRIGGFDIVMQRSAAVRQLGVLPEVPELVDEVSAERLLVHVAIMRGMARRAARQRAADLVEFLDLPRDAVIAQHSTGNRKKTALGCALVSSPPILLLDEPLEAVDPLAAERIVGLLRQLTAAGSTILLSTHDVRLAAEACDRVLVMAKGQLGADRAMGDGRGAPALVDDLRQPDVLQPAAPDWLA